VTAVHVDGGLRAVLSGAVLAESRVRLRRWENQRMLSSFSTNTKKKNYTALGGEHTAAMPRVSGTQQVR